MGGGLYRWLFDVSKNGQMNIIRAVDISVRQPRQDQQILNQTVRRPLQIWLQIDQYCLLVLVYIN